MLRIQVMQILSTEVFNLGYVRWDVFLLVEHVSTSLENATLIIVIFTEDLQYPCSMCFTFASFKGNVICLLQTKNIICPISFLAKLQHLLIGEQDRIINFLNKNTLEKCNCLVSVSYLTGQIHSSRLTEKPGVA